MTARRRTPIRLVAVIAAVLAILGAAIPATAASNTVALELHMVPNPVAYGAQVVLEGAVTRVSGNPANVRVRLEWSSSFTYGECEPACSSGGLGHAEWTFPSVTGRSTFRYTATNTGLGEFVRLFLLGGNAGCVSDGCPAEIALKAPSTQATLSYTSGSPVVTGSSIHVRSGGAANATPINGTLVVQLPPGTGAPTNISPGATYAPDPWNRVESVISLVPSASIEFDLPITAANGSTLTLRADFYPDPTGPTTAGASATIKVGPDSTDPEATRPKATLTTGSRVGGAPVRVAWAGSDKGSGIERYVLAQQVDGGSWTTVSSSITGTSVTRALVTGHSYRFRVRAIDHAGNAGPWATGSTFRLAGSSESSGSISYTGRWRPSASASFWGGRARHAKAVGAQATLTTTSRSVSWVAYRGPTRGRAQVFVNGTRVATVDLWAPTGRPQRVVWAKSWSSVARRTITIRVVTAYGRPRIDIDGMVAIR